MVVILRNGYGLEVSPAEAARTDEDRESICSITVFLGKISSGR